MEFSAFQYKSPVAEKLLAFGFKREGEEYLLARDILGGEFTVNLRISKKGVETHTVDAAGEEYVLHLVEGAQGTFVGAVREAFCRLLEEISAACFETDVFPEEAAHALISHVREKYGCELEFLWKDLPDAAVWRRQDNGKWFGALLSAPKKTLGIGKEGRINLVDLRADPAELDRIADGKKYFRGYHMNKKHWLSMPLDGSVPIEELCARLDESFTLAKKNKE